MLEAIKSLSDSGIISEEVRAEINEAWESKINEAKEQAKTELREEFAQRYEHDKSVMVEALDKMVTESLDDELRQIVQEKKALVQDRVRYNKKMTEAATRFESFLIQKLTEEIKELHADRKVQKQAIAKLEDFVVKSLAEEIEEFQIDKKQVIETKVRLVNEARKKINTLKQEFVKRSAKLVENTVTKNLTTELTQLKEDINASRKNDFGRRIFEAFVSEYSTSHLNTNVEIKKLKKELNEKASKLNEASQKVEKAKRIIESKQTELRVINDRVQREKVMQELLRPLNREKANAMKELLESVQTSNLRTAFDKYLPALLNEKRKFGKTVLSETRKVATGDKKQTEQPNDVIELDNIRKLAGI